MSCLLACAGWTGVLLASSSAPYGLECPALPSPISWPVFLSPWSCAMLCVCLFPFMGVGLPIGNHPLWPAQELLQVLCVPCSHLPFSGLLESFLWDFSFCFLKSANLSLFCGKKSSHSPSFSTSVTPAQKLWIYTDALRNPVQYCMARGTLGMSLLL